MTEFEPEHLARLVELSDDLICVGGADGYFFRVSPSWTRALGYTEEELRSRPFITFIHPEDAMTTAREVRRAIRGVRSRQFANRIRHKDGHYLWLRWNVAPGIGSEYAYAVASDITELHDATERLREQTELLRATERRLASEISRARDVQMAFFPNRALGLDWIDVAGECLPAREMSGDFVDWYELPGDRIAITVGDVMGKGVPAALLMSTTQTLLRASTFVGAGEIGVDPSTQMERTNVALHSSLGTVDRFVTAFTARLTRAGDLTYADAGHGHALVRRRTGEFESLDATGFPLGVEPAALYPNVRLQLEPGDTLLVATDGLRDVFDALGSGPWTARIAEAVSDWSSAESVVRDVVLWAESATEGVGAADDLTLVVAVFHGTASYVVTPTRTYEADVPPSLPVLARCTDEVRAFLGNAGLSADQTEQMVLGLHEVLANVIGHAHPTTPISVFIEVRDDHGFLNVEIVTRDDGRTFIEVPERPRGGERGRGLDMCRELFDVSEHLREGDKNVWVLARRFARAGGENRKENLLKEGIDG